MLKKEAGDRVVVSGPARIYERIILTGFRGTGKSVVGKKLAALLGRRFVDTDTELSTEMHSSVSQYVNRFGWPAFRLLEQQQLERLAGQKDLVVATGGGAVLHKDEWSRLRRHSLAVWLQADAETIRRRLERDSATGTTRPPLSDSDSLTEVQDLLAEREPLYRQGADIAVDTTGMTPEEIAAAIRDTIAAQQRKEKD